MSRFVVGSGRAAEEHDGRPTARTDHHYPDRLGQAVRRLAPRDRGRDLRADAADPRLLRRDLAGPPPPCPDDRCPDRGPDGLDRARPDRTSGRRGRRPGVGDPDDAGGGRGGLRRLLDDRRPGSRPGHDPQRPDPRLARPLRRLPGDPGDRPDQPGPADRPVDHRLPDPGRRGLRRRRRGLSPGQHGRPPRLALDGHEVAVARGRRDRRRRAGQGQARDPGPRPRPDRRDDPGPPRSVRPRRRAAPRGHAHRRASSSAPGMARGSRWPPAGGGRGPTVYDQPTYEVRPAEAGGYEARRSS